MNEPMRRHVLPFTVGNSRVRRWAGVFAEVICQPGGGEVCRLQPHEFAMLVTDDGETWRRVEPERWTDDDA